MRTKVIDLFTDLQDIDRKSPKRFNAAVEASVLVSN